MNTTLIKIAAAAAAVLIAAMLVYSAWSRIRLGRLEATVEKAAAKADDASRIAAEREAESAVFKEKIEYLETTVADIRNIAGKQDEKLEQIASDRRSARAAYDRARGTRSVTVSNAELCKQLADLGHPCSR